MICGLSQPFFFPLGMICSTFIHVVACVSTIFLVVLKTGDIINMNFVK